MIGATDTLLRDEYEYEYQYEYQSESNRQVLLQTCPVLSLVEGSGSFTVFTQGDRIKTSKTTPLPEWLTFCVPCDAFGNGAVRTFPHSHNITASSTVPHGQTAKRPNC
jgi:hypothetical protein